MEQLIRPLLVGDYARALRVLNGLEREEGLLDMQTFDEADVDRAAYAAAAAELYFYSGHNSKARPLLDAYAKDWKKFKKSLRTPRAQLQIAEYFYSQNQLRDHLHSARSIAEAVLKDAMEARDHRGIGEGCYYLMRITRRLHKYDDVARYRHQAIESFADAAAANRDDRKALSWRLGLVYLVAGFTQWRAGDLVSATSLLHTSRSLLEGTSDFIGQANVRHTMGVILRSRGRFADALGELESAAKLYKDANHAVNLARVYCDIGRVYLDDRKWKDAHDAFERAAQPHTDIGDRQKAEVLLWKSWLLQTPGSPYRDLDKADELSSKSLGLAMESLSVKVEAMIAHGNCAAERGDWKDAKERTGRALRFARDHGMTKHLANALLTLADFHSRTPPRDLALASRYLAEAEALFPASASFYLGGKVEAVRAQILGVKGAFVFYYDDVTKHGIRPSLNAFTLWAIETALEECDGVQKRAAERIKVKPASLRQALRRAYSKKKAKKPRKPGPRQAD